MLNVNYLTTLKLEDSPQCFNELKLKKVIVMDKADHTRLLHLEHLLLSALQSLLTRFNVQNCGLTLLMVHNVCNII